MAKTPSFPSLGSAPPLEGEAGPRGGIHWEGAIIPPPTAWCDQTERMQMPPYQVNIFWGGGRASVLGLEGWRLKKESGLRTPCFLY